MLDIHPIKPAIELAYFTGTETFVLGLIAMIVAWFLLRPWWNTLLFWRRWTRKPKPQKELSPHEQAFHSITELRIFIDQDQAQKFIFETSQILKKLLSDVHNAPFSESTTQEIHLHFQEKNCSHIFHPFFVTADEVKFTGKKISKKEAYALAEKILKFTR